MYSSINLDIIKHITVINADKERYLYDIIYLQFIIRKCTELSKWVFKQDSSCQDHHHINPSLTSFEIVRIVRVDRHNNTSP